MAQFKYSNSRNPKFILSLTIGAFVLFYGLYILGITINSESGWTLAAQIAYSVAMCFPLGHMEEPVLHH